MWPQNISGIVHVQLDVNETNSYVQYKAEHVNSSTFYCRIMKYEDIKASKTCMVSALFMLARTIQSLDLVHTTQAIAQPVLLRLLF
jgi:hypothetical protein